MPPNPNRNRSSNTFLPSRTKQNSLNIFQHNCCGSNNVFLSLCSILKPLKPDVIAVQDPYLFNDKPLNAPGFTLIFDHSSRNPKVATYINNNLLKNSSYIMRPTRSPNTLSVTLYVQDQPFQIHNIYNTPWNSTSLLGQEMFILSPFPTIVLGDFNLHSPLTDPLRHFSHEELRLSNPITDLAAERGYTLLNSPGLHTYFPHTHRFRSSTLDLAFTNLPFTKFGTSWNNNTPPTGSDHSAPLTTMHLSFDIPAYIIPDWNNIDWFSTSHALEEIKIPEPLSHENLDSWFDQNYNLLSNTLSSSTTIRRPSLWSKRWWSPN